MVMVMVGWNMVGGSDGGDGSVCVYRIDGPLSDGMIESLRVREIVSISLQQCWQSSSVGFPSAYF